MKKITLRIVALAFAIISLSSPVIAAIESEPIATTSTLPGDREVNSAVNELKTLSRKEKKNRIKEVKKILKQYRADKKAGKVADDNTILLAILAILLPPLAIYLKEEALTWKFWVSLGLVAIPIIFGAWYLWLLAVGLALLVVFDVL